MGYCCSDWEAKTKDEPYNGKAEFLDNEWNILGCCGHCYVLTDIRFCPFCGNNLYEKDKEVARKGWKEQILKAKEMEDNNN